MRFLSCSIALLLVTLASASAQKKVAPTTPFDSLLTLLKGGDTTVDYLKLRLSYAETPAFAPYAADTVEQGLFGLLTAKQWKEVVKQAKSVLSHNYVSLRAHYCLSVAYDRLERADSSLFHLAVVRGLVSSIVANGNGRSSKDAWPVITVAEEYFIMNIMGFTLKQQGLIKENGHSYDAMEVTDDESGEELTLYFNIDIPFDSIGKSLRRSK